MKSNLNIPSEIFTCLQEIQEQNIPIIVEGRNDKKALQELGLNNIFTLNMPLFKIVERINGKPQSVKKEGERTFLYYLTPLENFTNTVVLDKNIVSYSIENVFGSYRGTAQGFRTAYGSPGLLLYGVDGYFWFIYLNEGLAIETNNRDIVSIVYFVPQTKETFMTGLAKEFKLLEAPLEME